MTIEEYIRTGLIKPDEEGRYQWGDDIIYLPRSEP
jgi:hypothetical protein